MKIHTVPLRWYSDPSHGWLQVRRRDAERLGILSSISYYSYQSKKGEMIYLEEDRDAQILLDALSRSKDCLPKYSNDKSTDERSRIRSLPSFSHIFYEVVISKYGETFEVLDTLEGFCRRIDPTYVIPRPDHDHPWNWELYLEVLDRVTDWLQSKTYLHRSRIYWHRKHLIHTNDKAKADADLNTMIANLETLLNK